MSRMREITRLARRVPAVRRLLEAGDPGRRAALLLGTGLVDADLYARQLGVPAITAEAAALHYATEGYRQDLTINVLLDPALISARLMPTWRPILYDYLNSRAWFAPASGIWDALAYKESLPESLDHVGGPAGHLWERLRRGELLSFASVSGGGRDLPWSEVYATAAEALETHARRAREKIARLPHPRAAPPVAAVPPPASTALPLVSVVMPVWNRAGAMRTAIDSVFAQSWQNWELLIVDDGSWDDTVHVAQTVSARDPRVRVIEGAHEGVSAARNVGIAAASGEYVAFLDSDNTWQPSFLANVVGRMHAAGAESAYATIALESEGGTRYRDAPADFASLLAGNSIDLNTFVVRRAVLHEVGGFGTDLARAVDYDLILRVARRHAPLHVDTVGAIYDDRADSTDRISNTEALGWNTRVRLANDPDALPAPLTTDSGGEIVWLVQAGDPLLPAKLDRAVEIAEPGRRVRIVFIGARAGELALAKVAAIDRPLLDVELFDADEPYAYVVDKVAARLHAERFVVIDPRADPTAADILALDESLEETGVAASMPVSIAPDGTLLGIGAGLAATGAVPHRLLARHPEADSPRAPVEVPLLTGRSFAARTAVFRAVGGLDPLLFNDFELEAFTLALRAVGESVMLDPRARFWHPDTEAAFQRRDRAGSLRVIRSRTRHGDAADDGSAVYDLVGLEIVAWMDDPDARLHQSSDRRPLPEWNGRPTVIARRRPRTTQLDGREIPSLRWAIKIAAPAGPRGESWGDLHFAHALAQALRTLGQDAVIDVRESVARPTRYLDDIDLVIRGLDSYEPRAAAPAFLWVISHPDDVTKNEAQQYSAVFAASTAWSQRMTGRWGVPIEPLLQCTDPERFHPRGAVRSDSLLFVGNSRWVPRPSVVAPVEAGIPIDVYGSDWEPFIDPSHVKATYVDNREVAALYESASAVLNDHWSDMRREGFIANRVFDVVAAGGRVISDAVEGIEGIFGGAVVAYESGSDLVPLLQRDHDGLFADDDEILKISARIRAEHSFEARARTLVERAVGRSADSSS